jgi:hypothetical protein
MNEYLALLIGIACAVRRRTVRARHRRHWGGLADSPSIISATVAAFATSKARSLTVSINSALAGTPHSRNIVNVAL